MQYPHVVDQKFIITGCPSRADSVSVFPSKSLSVKSLALLPTRFPNSVLLPVVAHPGISEIKIDTPINAATIFLIIILTFQVEEAELAE